MPSAFGTVEAAPSCARGPRRLRHATRQVPFRGDGKALLHLLQPLPKGLRGKVLDRLDALLDDVTRYAHRMAYGDLRNRGYPIGSGAMEFLHRFGSQVRLKLAGCRWTPSVAQASLNVRMLSLSGRWDEF